MDTNCTEEGTMPAITVDNILYSPGCRARRARAAAPRTHRHHRPPPARGRGLRGVAPVPRTSACTTPTPSSSSTSSGRSTTSPARPRARLAPAPRLRDRHVLLDGEIAHHDSNGGGGVIGAGRHAVDDRRARASCTTSCRASDLACRRRSHGIQLWVNLPARLKFTPPRYQPLTGGELTLLASHDGAALVRLIAGDLDGHHGPGVDPHPDHVRARDAAARRASCAFLGRPRSRDGVCARGRGYARHRRPSDRATTTSRFRSRRLDRRYAPTTARPGPSRRSRRCCSADYRSVNPSRTTARS